MVGQHNPVKLRALQNLLSVHCGPEIVALVVFVPIVSVPVLLMVALFGLVKFVPKADTGAGDGILEGDSERIIVIPVFEGEIGAGIGTLEGDTIGALVIPVFEVETGALVGTPEE